MKEECPAGEQTYLILPAFSWIITKGANEILLAKDVGLCYNH